MKSLSHGILHKCMECCAGIADVDDVLITNV